MRPIKFRAWDRENKEFIYGGVGDIGFSKWVAYDTTTIIEQFTGLHDKNGKESYHSDKIRIHQFYFNGNECEYEVEGYIEYIEETASFGIRVTKGYQDIEVGMVLAFNQFTPHDEWLEVIGNIHEQESKE